MLFNRIKSILESAESTHRKRSELIGHFVTSGRGSFDNISWNKGDVGHFSKPVKDRHGFNSIYVRFKGQKSPKLIPVQLFKKNFKKSSNRAIDGWKPADRGGTKIKFTPSKKPLNRSEYEKNMGKSLKKKGKIMENNNILDIINAASEKNATQFQELVSSELNRRINDCIETAKKDVTASLFQSQKSDSEDTNEQ